MWLATQTRPDIANTVKAVARYCASPKLVHCKTALGILGYVWYYIPEGCSEWLEHAGTCRCWLRDQGNI